MKQLFVDSSGWIALANDRDKYHASAKRAWATHRNEQIGIVTTDYVFDETVTSILYQRGHRAATQFGRFLLASQTITLIDIDRSRWQRTWDFFQAYEDKTWALTDCASFVVMQELGIFTAFTYDKHFEQAGFQIWPE